MRARRWTRVRRLSPLAKRFLTFVLDYLETEVSVDWPPATSTRSPLSIFQAGVTVSGTSTGSSRFVLSPSQTWDSLPCRPDKLTTVFPSLKQLLSTDGQQLEAPDPWLELENPWEIPRLDVTYPVRFYGSAEKIDGSKGKGVWHGGQEVLAMAYDMPIPGHGVSASLLTLRYMD